MLYGLLPLGNTALHAGAVDLGGTATHLVIQPVTDVSLSSPDRIELAVRAPRCATRVYPQCLVGIRDFAEDVVSL
jgi:hypothetical protein